MYFKTPSLTDRSKAQLEATRNEVRKIDEDEVRANLGIINNR
jgi:hypothetical protein